MPTNVRYRDADGFTQVVGTTEDLGQVVSSPSAVVNTTPIKVCLENISDRALGASPFAGVVLHHEQVGTNDGISLVYTALDTINGTLSKPWGADVDAFDVPTGAPEATMTGPYGVWAATGDYGVVVTALNAAGETIASVEKVVTVSDVSEEWTYEWAHVPGATGGYNIYRTDVDDAGTYGAYSLIGHNAAVGDVTFADDGSPQTIGTPPSENTTGGAGPTYGTAPAAVDHTTADKTIAAAPAGLAVGEQWFFWLMAKIPAGTSSTGNKRIMRLQPTEG
jgi:hypothetical protein